MPVTVMVGLLGLLLAVICYSVGTWRAFRAKSFSRVSIIALWLGVLFDLTATAAMAASIGRLDFSATGWLHTVLALLVMAGMLLATIVATVAFTTKSEALAKTTAKLIVAPWVLWVVVFVWGMATKMPRR